MIYYHFLYRLFVSIWGTAIVKHSLNILKEQELDDSTCSILEQVQIEGGRKVKRKSKIYNLDMIIAVGYRVNSKRGTLFRRWANSVLKQYLLRGYAIDSSRAVVTQENYLNLVNVVNRIDSKQTEIESRVESLENKNKETGHKIFFADKFYDAKSIIDDIIFKAEKEIILIDNYTDKFTLDMLRNKRDKSVSVLIITTAKNGLDSSSIEVKDFIKQYGQLNIAYSNKFHDRFIIIDKKELYSIGASIKDAGRKTFAINKMNDENIVNALLLEIKNL